MLNNNFILHLTLIEGISSSIVKRIIESQRSGVQTSDFYSLSAAGWINYFGIPEKIAYKLVAGLSDMKILEKELDLIAEHAIKWITIADESYPPLLKEIHYPPFVLYFYGDMQLFSSKSIAVVGSRKATHYGEKIISTIVPDLIAADYTIISGGALGIDTMAHEAALQCGGKTIVILGSGLLRLYPSSNKKLFARIVENGGIVATPYPAMMEGFPHNFPARNRIVTGLSKGCLVVQAAQKSGALISAHCALDQGREVFAVPGLFDDELSAGCHEIIQQGAKLVTSSTDIFNELGDKIIPKKPSLEQQVLFTEQSYLLSRKHPELVDGYPRAKMKQVHNAYKTTHYSQTQQKIIAACVKPLSLDDIVSTTDLSFDVVQSELFNLQLDGVVSQDFTGMWISIK
jgi:DNA processing protein